MRQEFTKAVRRFAWRRCQGRCEQCTAWLVSGKFEYHHVRECFFGGDGSGSNCLVLCIACHSEITKARSHTIAKSMRVADKHAGIRKPHKFKGWRAMNGEVRWASDRKR